MIQKIDPSNFSELVMKSEVPVLLSFGAEWCGPCKGMQPVLESIASEYEQRAIVGKVDVDELSGNLRTIQRLGHTDHPYYQRRAGGSFP